MLFAVADWMPPNSLESFQCSEFQEQKEYEMSLRHRLKRHSASLRRIILDDVVNIGSSAISFILNQYPKLEVFRVTESPRRKMKVFLTSLTVARWKCANLRELQLAITLHEGPDPKKLLYPKQTSGYTSRIYFPISVYECFGALGELRILDLRVSRYSKELPCSSGFSRTDYRKRTFPGLMLLDDGPGGRYGYLQALSGLSNLEELHGSFNLDAMLSGFEFEQREADWVVQHWPKLQFIEFFTRRRGDKTVLSLSPAFQSLVDRLPGLVVC
jgi:hypothetical protein